MRAIFPIIFLVVWKSNVKEVIFAQLNRTNDIIDFIAESKVINNTNEIGLQSYL